MDKITLPLHRNYNINEFIKYNLASRVEKFGKLNFYKYKIIKNQLEVEILANPEDTKSSVSQPLLIKKLPSLLLLLLLLLLNLYILSINHSQRLHNNKLKILSLNTTYVQAKANELYKLHNQPKFEILKLCQRLPLNITYLCITAKSFTFRATYEEKNQDTLSQILKNSPFDMRGTIEKQSDLMHISIEGKI